MNFVIKIISPKVDIKRFAQIKRLFLNQKIDIIIHLAAQAGVRHSLKKPRYYIDTNLIGFFNILEISKIINVKHLVFAGLGAPSSG